MTRSRPSSCSRGVWRRDAQEGIYLSAPSRHTQRGGGDRSHTASEAFGPARCRAERAAESADVYQALAENHYSGTSNVSPISSGVCSHRRSGREGALPPPTPRLPLFHGGEGGTRIPAGVIERRGLSCFGRRMDPMLAASVEVQTQQSCVSCASCRAHWGRARIHSTVWFLPTARVPRTHGAQMSWESAERVLER